ncbi:MAG: AtpZ/AtpI family protein [Candidatus Melainabacteria bacterium]|nr:AtpZ/AtpI family protein [Candidatus Melainabacteria bacterium]
MKDPSEQKSVNEGGPSTVAMAAQWGMALVVYTCVFGFGGYFIGDRLLHSQMWAVGLMMAGLTAGFSAAIYQIFRTSQQIERSMPNRGKPLPDDPEEEKSSLF